jgi:gas vesicle protein
MYYEKEPAGAMNFLAGLAIGAIIGASVAFLAAPQSGKRTRRQIARAVADARRVASDEWGDTAREMKRAVVRGRRRMMR